VPSGAAGDVENCAAGRAKGVLQKRQISIGGRRNRHPEIDSEAVKKIVSPIVGSHFVSIVRGEARQAHPASAVGVEETKSDIGGEFQRRSVADDSSYCLMAAMMSFGTI
jgi:hypothetical protein